MHKCKARHVEDKLVIELFRDEVAWDGVVEAFELVGHPHAKRCYAWSYDENGETQYVNVLEIPPVDSAETAVKIAISAHAKQSANPAAIYLADQLERLMALPLNTKADLENWESERNKVEQTLHDKFPSFEPIHFFWHFMDDADIRVRDSGYRDSQNQTISRYIADLRNKSAS